MLKPYVDSPSKAWRAMLRLRPTITGLSRRVVESKKGAAAVEFALLAPVLAGLFIPIADIGRYAYIKMQVQLAGQAGAEYAATQGASFSAIQQVILGASPNIAGLTALPSSFDQAHAFICGCVTGTTGFESINCTGTSSLPKCPSSGQQAYIYLQVGAKAPFTPLFQYPFVNIPPTVSWCAFVRTGGGNNTSTDVGAAVPPPTCA